MKKIKVFISVIVVVLITVYIGNNSIKISEYNIENSKIPDEFNNMKILQLSDLHSKKFGKDNSYLVKKINEINPDIVVMTGDMMNSKGDDGEVLINIIKKLGNKYHIYYIVGNHEQILESNDSELFKNYLDKLVDLKVKVINNDKIELKKEKSVINLYGMWINLRYYVDKTNNNQKDITFNDETVNQILKTSDKGSFNLLITHNPLYFEAYSKWGADLTLAGHIHGGIINIPFVGGVLSPEKKLFPKYYGGDYVFNNSNMIVNRGLGNEGYLIRVFNRPEMSVINLKN